MKIKGLYAGSFDPLTKGHYDIIKRASKLCDELVVGVINNPQKNHFLNIQKRKELIEETLKQFENVKVETFCGLLADYVNENQFNVVIRGLRNSQDFDNEIPMAQVNAKLYSSKVETIFMMTSPEYAFISSSMVREVASLGGEIRDLVPEVINNEIKKIFKI